MNRQVSLRSTLPYKTFAGSALGRVLRATRATRI